MPVKADDCDAVRAALGCDEIDITTFIGCLNADDLRSLDAICDKYHNNASCDTALRAYADLFNKMKDVQVVTLSSINI